MPNIEATGLNSRAFQDKILEEAGLAIFAETSFGAWGEGFVRFSYANSMQNIVKALQLIKELL